MKTIPLLLCAVLIALPFELSAQSQDPQPEPTSFFQAVVSGTIVIIATVAVYTVYKTAHATQDRCRACQQIVPPNAYYCPGCGQAYRCEECGTRLSPTATQCPKCSTPVPPPKPVLKTVQKSINGVDWFAVDTFDPNAFVLSDDLSILSFPTQGEFDAWCSTQTNIVSIKSITLDSAALFRLSSE
jgi:ribosomal protein L40E